MSDSRLSFDEELHEYRWDGKVVPSVTQVLDDVGLVSNFAKNEHAAKFGTAFHKTTAILDRGNKCEYDPQLQPWIDSWDKFKKDFKIEAFAWIELPLYSETFKFAGTVDRVYHFKYTYVVDLKTSTSKSKTWPLQLSAYAHLVGLHIGAYTPRHLRVVQISEKGYNVNTCKPQFDLFLSALNIYKFKRR